MKTNQVMIRPMGQFEVVQRTKDGMFNATALLKQWNAQVDLHTQKNGYVKKKDLDDYLSNKNTKLFIQTIINRENLNTPKMVCLKSRASRGDNSGTWMHPLLFIDFAMWLNPAFKYDVLKFVYDQMIQYRNNAGDAYRELSAAVATIVPRSEMKSKMRKIGEALNWIIFNAHEKMMRNKQGEEDKQKELWMFEKKVATLINEGFIRKYDELINYLRKQYALRDYPKVFAS